MTDDWNGHTIGWFYQFSLHLWWLQHQKLPTWTSYWCFFFFFFWFLVFVFVFVFVLFFCLFLLFCFVLFCFVLFCFVLFCFVLFCFVLFRFVLFCFVFYFFILFYFIFLTADFSSVFWTWFERLKRRRGIIFILKQPIDFLITVIFSLKLATNDDKICIHKCHLILIHSSRIVSVIIRCNRNEPKICQYNMYWH